jgi:hypothetical protein
MKRLWPLVATAFCVAGCSATYPIRGVVDKTNERFLGSTTVSAAEENGTITIVTDKDATCTGAYPRVFSSTVSGRGTFTCSDGRTGMFAFAGQARYGNGFGKFSDGHKFTFTYGDENKAMADDAAMGMALQSMGQSMKAASAPAPMPNMQVYSPPRSSISCTSRPSFGGTSIQTNCY